MNTLLTTILKSISGSITTIIVLALKVVKSFFDYKKAKLDDKKEQKEEKHDKEVDDVVDNGSIEDLLDLKR